MKNTEDESKKRKVSSVYEQKFVKIKEVTEHKLFVFVGLMIMARIVGRHGDLWDKSEPEGVRVKIDVAHHMKKYCFDIIRSYISHLFSTANASTTIPWWMITDGIKKFNENRQRTILASSDRVINESMSAFCPQTHKFGNLPFLSFIARKLEPLGIELKVIADCTTSVILWMEIQRGKFPMREAEYSSLHGVTAAVAICGALATSKKDPPVSDSMVNYFK